MPNFESNNRSLCFADHEKQNGLLLYRQMIDVCHVCVVVTRDADFSVVCPLLSLKNEIPKFGEPSVTKNPARLLNTWN